MTARPRILCVDDEPRVLDGLARLLRNDFEVVTEVGGPAALRRLYEDRGFSAIICDMFMPGINGVGVLREARNLAPAISRILLTGQPDLPSVVSAVNDGEIFRFLTKPCKSDRLKAVLDQAVAQHQLITAERELLENTLHGSVQALVEVLALSNPAVFGRATRVRSLVSDLAGLIGYRDRSQMEMAAVLSQLGVVALNPATALRYGQGAELSQEEEEMIAQLPELALRLLKGIPRLDEIKRILEHLGSDFEGDGPPGTARGEEIPLGALLIRPALDYDVLLTRGCRPDEAMARLRARGGAYDSAVLTDIGRVTGADSGRVIMELTFQNVQLGMAFVDDVRAPDGTLLVARGQVVTTALLVRIGNYWSDLELPAPVRVAVRMDSTIEPPSLIDAST